MRELRITAVVPVPDELFESAEMLAKLRPTIDGFGIALTDIHKDATITSDLVTPRAKGEAAEPAPRARRRSDAS